MSAPVFVKLGLATPLGLTARATQNAIAAGMSAFSETAVLDTAGEPVRAARLASLDPAWTREERMIYFAQRAVRECLSGVDPRKTTPILCFLGWPEEDSRPFDELQALRGLQAAIDPAMPLDWSPRDVRHGRAGVFFALEAAMSALQAGRARLALVGGIDSNCDRASLEHFAGEGRTLGKSNPDGLIPGEGAGFVLLARADAAGAFPAPLGRLVACATAKDTLPFGKRNPMKAVALTAMFRQLRQACAGEPRPGHLFSCQTGEGFWARELNNAYLRNVEIMPEPFRTSLVAESLGDMGAGAGIVEIAMASHLFATGWRSDKSASRAIVYGAADGGQVGGGMVADR